MNQAGLNQREFQIQTRELPVEGGEGRQELWVEGYAVRFNSPTVLWESEQVQYKEQICRGAFDNCRMDDVIFNYNHGGKVMARTRNHTLQLNVDEEGLFVRARLDGTEEGRKLYDEIKGGYIDKMSFRFKIQDEAFDSAEHQWNIKGVKRLYDVSAVDIPAYDDTSITARKAQALDAEAQKQAAADAALARKRLETKLKLLEGGFINVDKTDE